MTVGPIFVCSYSECTSIGDCGPYMNWGGGGEGRWSYKRVVCGEEDVRFMPTFQVTQFKYSSTPDCSNRHAEGPATPCVYAMSCTVHGSCRVTYLRYLTVKS